MLCDSVSPSIKIRRLPLPDERNFYTLFKAVKKYSPEQFQNIPYYILTFKNGILFPCGNVYIFKITTARQITPSYISFFINHNLAI